MQQTTIAQGNTISVFCKVKRLVPRFVSDKHDQDDLVQDVMVKILSSLSKMPSNAWLWSVVRNAAYDHYRQVRRENKYINRSIDVSHIGFVAEHCAGFYGIVPAADDTLPGQFLSDDIKNLFGCLTRHHAQALALAASGFSYEEIAKLTDTKLGTVRSRIHHARKQASKFLTQCK